MTVTVEVFMMIHILHKQGYSQRRIARELGLSVNTVRRHLEEPDYQRYKKRPPKPMKLDGYLDHIQQRLKAAHPHWIPATVMFREIKARGYTGGLSRLTADMRTQKPQVKQTPQIRFETEPGQQMQVDWAEFRRGKDRLAAFVGTLGFSRVSYVRFVTNEKLATLIRCHELAFDYFGGIPREILYDNMKTVIVSRDYYGKNKHRLQLGFWDFSKHCHFIPLICRPYRGQTKGKVERFIRYLRYSFYLPLLSQLADQGKTADVDTMNQEVLIWLNQIANQRVHGTTGKVPLQQLPAEQSALQPTVARYTGITSIGNGLPAQPVCSDERVMALPTTSVQHDLSVYEALLVEDKP